MGTLGVGLDIFADPLTYMGVGLIGKGAKAAEGTSRVARIAEGAKPDVVQLGELVGKGVKRIATGRTKSLFTPVTRKAGAANDVLTTLQALQASIKATVTSDPKEAAKLTAQIVKATGAGKESKAVDNILAGKGSPEFSVEHLLPAATPEIGALQAKIAEVTNAPTVKVDLNAEATRLADIKYDKEMGSPKGETMADFRKKAAADPNAAKTLKAIEADENYVAWRSSALKRLEKKTTGAVPPVAPAQKIVETVTKNTPDTITKTTPPVAAQSNVQKLIDTQNALDNTQTRAVHKTVNHLQDVMTPGKPKYENLKAANIGGTQGPHTEFTHVKQVNAWEKLRAELLVSDAGKMKAQRRALAQDPEWISRVVNAQKHLEEIMAASGKAARADRDDPIPLRLSAFLERMSPEEIMRGAESKKFFTEVMTKRTSNPKFDTMYDEVRAAAMLEDAAKIKPVIATVLDTIEAAAKSPLDEITPDAISSAAAVAKAAAKQADISPSGQELIKNVAQEAKTAAKELPTADGVHRTGDLVKATEEVRVAATVGKAEDAAIPLTRMAADRDRYLGIYFGNRPVARIANLSKLGRNGRAVGENAGLKKFFDVMDATEDWFALSFRTAFGKDDAGNVVSMGSDIKTLDRAAVNNANQRSHAAMEAYQKIFAGTGPDDRLRMLSDAQLDDTHPIAQRMAEVIDTAKRNGITPSMANDFQVKHYRKGEDIPFKFEAAKMDALGNGHKFDDMFDSWKVATVKGDVAQHLMKLETAVDKAVVNQQVMINFASRFGTTVAEPGLKSGADLHPLLTKHFFAPDDHVNMKNYLNMTREFGEQSSPLMQHFDQVQGVWKTMATRINPQYYARNGVGEVFINWLNGVNSVKPYRWANKTMSWRMPEVAVDALTAGSKPVESTEVLFKHSKFGDITADMAWKGFSQFGARQTFAITDNLTDVGLQKAPNRFMAGLNGVADYEESVLRMAHFLDAVSKSKARNLVEAMEDAAATVNRAHGDYADLTRFERKVMKRVIPFYTWQRKVTPILLESALRNPGKIMVYPKIQIMLAQNYGLELDNANPFPQPNQIMPEWMQEAAQVPYFHRTNGNVVMGDPSNPFNDQVKQLNHPGEALGSMLTPAIKIPMEMGVRRTDDNPNGTQFFGNIPIKDKTNYLADQIPLLSTINRLTRQDVASGGQRREGTNYGTDEQGVNTIAIINWLTAAGLQENTKRRQTSGEFDAKERAAKAKKARGSG